MGKRPAPKRRRPVPRTRSVSAAATHDDDRWTQNDIQNGEAATETETETSDSPELKEDAVEDQITARRLRESSPDWQPFWVWIVGTSPLICHAWSEKAKWEMLNNQQKKARDVKEPRDPQGDFVSSLYELRPGTQKYGFPLTGVKDCILSLAHKDRGMAGTVARANVFLTAHIYKVHTAFVEATCEMPLMRLWGPEPKMREDMVRIGTGMRRTASLAYRAQFWPWAIKVRGVVNVRAVPAQALQFLAGGGGTSTGIGDWRPEKSGIFGRFRLALHDAEIAAWEAYRRGGPLPQVTPWILENPDLDEFDLDVGDVILPQAAN